MRNFLFTMFFLAATSLSLCQDFATATAEIEVIIPNNQIVTQLQIFIEERDLDTQFQMAPGITLAQLIALGGITVNQPTGTGDTVLVVQHPLADQKYWRVAAVGFNTQGIQVTNIPVTPIVRKPLEYNQATIFINLRFQ